MRIKKNLKKLPNKKGLGNHLIGNPIIEKVTKFKETMSNWNREDPCKICHEFWFDQDNVISGKYIGIYQRCRTSKDTEIATIPLFLLVKKLKLDELN